MVIAAAILFLIMFALLGAGVGYILPPLLSDALSIPRAYGEAHPWYQRIGAAIGAALVIGLVLALVLGYPGGL